jgi:hypothetical protein
MPASPDDVTARSRARPPITLMVARTSAQAAVAATPSQLLLAWGNQLERRRHRSASQAVWRRRRFCNRRRRSIAGFSGTDWNRFCGAIYRVRRKRRPGVRIGDERASLMRFGARPSPVGQHRLRSMGLTHGADDLDARVAPK